MRKKSQSFQRKKGNLFQNVRRGRVFYSKKSVIDELFENPHGESLRNSQTESFGCRWTKSF